MPKLNQILAIEKGKKTTLHQEITDLHKATQKAQLVTGHHKTYQPVADDGESFPDDVQHVQYRTEEVIDQVTERLATLMDVTATKDWANCTARADVIVNGEVFLPNVPVTYMLFLEKELNDLHTFVTKMVELDPGEKWTLDPNSGLFRSGEAKTHKTKKMQRAGPDSTRHRGRCHRSLDYDEVLRCHPTSPKEGTPRAYPCSCGRGKVRS